MKFWWMIRDLFKKPIGPNRSALDVFWEALHLVSRGAEDIVEATLMGLKWYFRHLGILVLWSTSAMLLVALALPFWQPVRSVAPFVYIGLMLAVVTYAWPFFALIRRIPLLNRDLCDLLVTYREGLYLAIYLFFIVLLFGPVSLKLTAILVAGKTLYAIVQWSRRESIGQATMRWTQVLVVVACVVGFSLRAFAIVTDFVPALQPTGGKFQRKLNAWAERLLDSTAFSQGHPLVSADEFLTAQDRFDEDGNPRYQYVDIARPNGVTRLIYRSRHPFCESTFSEPTQPITKTMILEEERKALQRVEEKIRADAEKISATATPSPETSIAEAPVVPEVTKEILIKPEPSLVPIHWDPPRPTPAPMPQPMVMPTLRPTPTGITLAEATPLLVFINDVVNADNLDSFGNIARAQIAADVEQDGVVVLPEGAPAEVRVNRIKKDKKQYLTFQLVTVAPDGNSFLPLETQTVEHELKRNILKWAAKGALGGIILGAIVDGKEGAIKGGVIGGAAGAGYGVTQKHRAKGFTPNKDGSPLRLNLSQPLTIPRAYLTF